MSSNHNSTDSLSSSEINLLKRAAITLVEMDEAEAKWIADNPEIPDPDPADENWIWKSVKEEYARKKKSFGCIFRLGLKKTVILITLLLVFLALVLSVSAFKVPILNFIYEHYDEYTRLVLDTDGYVFAEKPENWTNTPGELVKQMRV